MEQIDLVLGQVFRADSGTETHEGLYVMDGSVVPIPLDVNPSLTISALAERNVAKLLEARQGSSGVAAT